MSFRAVLPLLLFGLGCLSVESVAKPLSFEITGKSAIYTEDDINLSCAGAVDLARNFSDFGAYYQTIDRLRTMLAADRFPSKRIERVFYGAAGLDGFIGAILFP